jgi:site-specific recombinase XerD
LNIMRPVSTKGMNIIAEFIASSENAALNPKTIKEYAGDLKHFIGWHEYKSIDSHISVTEFAFRQVNEAELSAYKKAMQEVAELKIATINRRLITLKMFFEWAVDKGYLACNPSLNIKLLPPEKILPRKISANEEKMLTEAVSRKGSLRDQAIIKMMLNTGLKTGEVCRIVKTDIELSKRRGFLMIKNEEGLRRIPLNPACRDILGKYLATLTPDHGYLFPSEKTGEMLGARALRHIIKKYMKIAGLDEHNSLSIRHRFGYSKALNTPIHKLAEIMGHNNLSSTMVYLKREDKES